MSYIISESRKRVYDALSGLGVEVYDAIPDQEQPTPFVVISTIVATPSSKCSYSATVNVSLFSSFYNRGGRLEDEDVANNILVALNGIGDVLDITASGSRNFNRATYEQRFQLQLN